MAARCTAAVIVAASASLAGCTSKYMTVTTFSKVGIDVTAGPASVVPPAVVGYKRFEGAIIPVDPAHVTDEASPDAPSVFTLFAMRNDWLGGVRIYQAFATGHAAEVLSGATQDEKKGDAK